MDPADLRRLAWQQPELDPCPTCGMTPKHACKTASGANCPPHKPRLDEARGWVARQAEVDGLYVAYEDALAQASVLTRDLQAANAELTGRADQIAVLTRDLAATKSERAVALHDLDAATDQNGVLTDQVRDTQRALFIAEDELAKARARIAELEAGEPEPEPEPVKRLPFGIGTVEKAASSAFPMLFNVAALEQAAGVKFTYMHEYFTFSATGATAGIVSWCETQLKAGRIPIPTAKLPGGDWVAGAAGKYDAGIKATVDALEALAIKYNSRVIFGVHHESDNDGKSLASWKALLDHLGPIMRRPGLVEFWSNYTGWAQLYGDADDWKLADLPTDQVDGVSFDPYLSLGGSSTKLTSMRTAYLEKFAAWAKSRGIQWGIWETGLNEDAAVSTTFPAVKTWIVDTADDAHELDATMWVYWNNRVNADKEDWRISKTLPANKHGQIVAAMQKYAPKEK